MKKFDKVDENPFTCDGPLDDAPQQMSDRELLIRLEEKVKFLSQMVYSEFKNLQDFMKAQKELITKVEEEVEKDLKAVQKQYRADCEYIHNEIAIVHQRIDKMKEQDIAPLERKVTLGEGAIGLLYLLIAIIAAFSIRVNFG